MSAALWLGSMVFVCLCVACIECRRYADEEWRECQHRSRICGRFVIALL